MCETIGSPANPDFFVQHKEMLHSLLMVSGLEQAWADDLPTLVKNTQAWTRGDHFNPTHDVCLDEDQAGQIQRHFTALGMFDAIMPPGGAYDQIVILGGTMRTNDARTAFAAAQLERSQDPVELTSSGTVSFWAGPRTRQDGLELQPTLDMLQVITHDPVADAEPWLKRQLSLEHEQQILTEVEQGRLSLLRHFGERALTSQIHLRWGDRENVVSHYVSRQGIVLMNALPVPRKALEGKSRHTTESCAQEWIEHHLPEAPGRILLVSSNPYVQRTTMVVRRELDKAGLDKTEVVGCGPATLSTTPTRVLFGELARLLWQVQNS